MFKHFLLMGLLLASSSQPYFTCNGPGSSSNSAISGAEIVPASSLPPESILALDSNLKPNSEELGLLNIWSVQNNGGNLKALAYQDRFTSFKPQISPDKSKILFWANRPLGNSNEAGPNNLWLMSIDGSNLQALTQSKVQETFSHWETAQYSPDGRKIIFLSSRNLNGSNQDPENPSLNLWIMNSDGGDLHPLTRFETRTTLTQAQWSPDGNKIAFLSNINPSIENLRQGNILNIWMIDPDGTHLQAVTRFQRASVSDYDWSSNSLKFVFTSNLPRDGNDLLPARNNQKLWTLTTNSSQLTLLTALDNSTNYHPLWSPNGKQIVYISNRKPDGSDVSIPAYNLWLYNVEDNSHAPVTKLLSETLQHFPYEWSKESNKILFLSNRHSDKSDKINLNNIDNLWIINPDGNDLGNVTGLNKAGQNIEMANW